MIHTTALSLAIIRRDALKPVRLLVAACDGTSLEPPLREFDFVNGRVLGGAWGYATAANGVLPTCPRCAVLWDAALSGTTDASSP